MRFPLCSIVWFADMLNFMKWRLAMKVGSTEELNIVQTTP